DLRGLLAASGQSRLRKELVVFLGVPLAARRPFIQMAQLGGHDGGLQRVQPEISSYKFVMVFRLGAVRAQALQSFGPPRVVGNNHSPITGRAKILGWKERKASIVPDGAGSPAFVF